MHWRPEDLDRLERAVDEGARVQISRRGTEYVVLARRLETGAPGDVLVGALAKTREEMRFPLEEIDDFVVLL